jgi:hypothetical protein
MTILLNGRDDLLEEELEGVPFLRPDGGAAQRRRAKETKTRVKEKQVKYILICFKKLAAAVQDNTSSEAENIAELSVNAFEGSLSMFPSAIDLASGRTFDGNVRVGEICLETYPSIIRAVSKFAKEAAREGKGRSATFQPRPSAVVGSPCYITVAVAVERQVLALTLHSLRSRLETNMIKLDGVMELPGGGADAVAADQESMRDPQRGPVRLTVGMGLGGCTFGLHHGEDELIGLVIKSLESKGWLRQDRDRHVNLICKMENTCFRSLQDPKAVFEAIHQWRKDHFRWVSYTSTVPQPS